MSASAPRVTTCDPVHSLATPFDRAMFLDSLNHIGAAAWCESTIFANPRTQHALVHSDQHNQAVRWNEFYESKHLIPRDAADLIAWSSFAFVHKD